ncbi:unnamed protein product [Linum tenue]|uniref:Transmembrane protein n=1 Tax=Linum tenue TaxID=586396 RepID=A0AAV0IMB4_9ROSI|nr:unnamed protein product [Linum tenue]
MAVKAGSFSVSCDASSLSSPLKLSGNSKLSSGAEPCGSLHFGTRKYRNATVSSSTFLSYWLQNGRNVKRTRSRLSATSQEQSEYGEVKPEVTDQEHSLSNPESKSIPSTSFSDVQGTGGKPGLVSFNGHQYKPKAAVSASSSTQNNQSSLLWFLGPAVLVASFIFPSIYLRRVLSIIFEDSLLTDFLILFFTEAIFYCGVAVFLLLIDRLRRPDDESESHPSNQITVSPPQLAHRISSVATLVLSLIVPMVTMGLVWPWTGPAASATLAPYLVGIVVQFAFEQYARSRKSPSWPVIPIIFQLYRLHQLNRAAQLVTALSYTVKAAEMTTHNLEISSSLGTLLNVLQFLGVICIWSLSSFLMRFFPSDVRKVAP